MIELERGARATVQVKKLGSCRCLSVVRSGSRASEWRVLQAGYGRGQGGKGQGGLDIDRKGVTGDWERMSRGAEKRALLRGCACGEGRTQGQRSMSSSME